MRPFANPIAPIADEGSRALSRAKVGEWGSLAGKATHIVHHCSAIWMGCCW